MKSSLFKLFPFLSIILLSSIVLTILSGARVSTIKEDDFSEEIRKKLALFTSERPEDRMYLHLDKPMYKPGDDIWFSAYLRDAEKMGPSKKSEILYVELISPKGNTESTIKLISRNGQSKGDIQLDPESPGGIYKIRAWSKWMENETNKKLFEKSFLVQKVVLPRLKMKLDFKKKSYGAGAKVEADLNLSTNQNEYLKNHPFEYIIELDGKKISSSKGNTSSFGHSVISFTLPEPLFAKEGILNIMIPFEGFTESISKAIPIPKKDLNIRFFPEGGDLIQNLSSNVAIKCSNNLGKAVDIAGTIIDRKTKKEITTFESFHNGMGAFELSPLEGSEYALRIDQPEGIDSLFTLPQSLPMGMVLNVEKRKKILEININSSYEDEVILGITQRGKLQHSQKTTIQKGKNSLNIDTDKMSMGPALITLFDGKGIPRAERMAFLNYNKRLNVSIKTDKDKYLPREKVKMDIMVTDERGIPMPANLSMAVVDDQLLSYADDKSSNILSALFLEPEFKETIEEPSFYFNPKEKKAEEALEYLMMTAGWRRFSWKEIISGDLPELQNNGELAIIKGVILDGESQKPLANAGVSIAGRNERVAVNDKGEFTIRKIDLFEELNLEIKREKYRSTNLHVSNYGTHYEAFMYPERVRNRNFPMGMGMQMNAMDVDMAMPPPQAMMMEEPMIEENMKMVEMAPMEVEEMEVKRVPRAPKGQVRPVKVVEKQIDLPVVDKIKDEGPRKKMIGDVKERRNLAAGAKRDEIALFDMDDEEPQRIREPQVYFYRAREFKAPKYDDKEAQSPTGSDRNDFRSTIFWNGAIEIPRSGRKHIEFYTSDKISSFSCKVEGIGVDGLVGMSEFKFFTQLPLSISAIIPMELVSGDQVDIPISLKNNTMHSLQAKVKVNLPPSLSPQNKLPEMVVVPAMSQKVIYVPCKVINIPGTDRIMLDAFAQGLQDGISQEVTVVSRGFPVNLSYSGREMEREVEFSINDLVKGSLSSDFTAYPSTMSDLLKGIEGLLREPSGCFEQTSSSSYPNLLALEYLQKQEEVDPEIYKRAETLLKKGYKKLTGYETKNKGFEWFGASPPHEALTAYGLLQFTDMQKVTDIVDDQMVTRTANWLMSRKDGQGGFQKNPKQLDSYGGASKNITDAYIVYSLAEAGYKNIEKEYAHSKKEAIKENDPYMLGLMANASYSLKKVGDGNELMEKIMTLVQPDGGFKGKTSSITRSTGNSLAIETTSLAVMGMLRMNDPPIIKIEAAIESVLAKRSGAGYFGSTQGTIMALKALNRYAEFSKRAPEDGEIELYINGKLAETIPYAAGQKDLITSNSLIKHMKEGKNKMRIKYIDVKNPLPYSLAVTYNTNLPESSKNCKLDLKTSFADSKSEVGATLRYSAKLINTTTEGLPSTLAILGIPSGYTAQPWQLKELQEKGVYDFYEIKGNRVFCYYRQMEPSEIKEINLDLKAEVPGKFEPSASTAYLYYTNEDKIWTQGKQVEIKAN